MTTTAANNPSNTLESDTALVSVRGEARMLLAPDFATLTGTLTAIGATKAGALRLAAAALTRSWSATSPFSISSAARWRRTIR
jgi:uncharacterized protein YggE